MNPEPNALVMDYSARIKLERQKRSWTQEQLAERARLSARTVQRIERGAEASAETLRMITEAFGLTPDELRLAGARIQFGAPWSRFVKITTAVMAALAVGAQIAVPLFKPAPFILWMSPFLAVVVLACLFLSVHGFTVRGGRLFVHRLGWATEFDLAELAGFEANAHAMMGSIRLFGNGGLFAFIGWYRNPVLGIYRAYVTDPARAVVLDFVGGRKIVVSPDDPEAFVAALREAARGVCRAETASGGRSDEA